MRIQYIWVLLMMQGCLHHHAEYYLVKIKAGQTIESIAHLYHADPEQLRRDYARGSHLKVGDYIKVIPNVYAPKGLLFSGAENSKLAWPAHGRLSSGFGRRWFRMHEGIDIATPKGSVVRAADRGEVSFVGYKKGYGLTVDIRHQNLTTRYAHLSHARVTKGTRVERGDAVASTGSSGHSTGPHLHFEVRDSNFVAHDPLIFLSRR